MKRLALLIGSPSDKNTPEAGKYLSGVKTDIENMYSFLSSSEGGSWSKDEIEKFVLNPSYRTVEPFLKKCEEVDFAFVYFSGHGGTDVTNNEPRVQFRFNDNPFVKKDLANRAKRQITIIDACRTNSKYYNAVGSLYEGASTFTFDKNNREDSKKIYSDYINKIPNSRVLLYATSHGSESLDYGLNMGGLFSSNLFKAVEKIKLTHKKPIIDIAKVFSEAKIETIKKEYKQVPILYTSKPDVDALKLPFSVNPFNNLSSIKLFENYEQKQTDKTDELINLALIGAGIIAVGIIIGTLINDNKK